MGNRAVIQMKGSNAGFYVHWNGGMDSVRPFLDLMKRIEITGRFCDDTPETLIAKLSVMWRSLFGGEIIAGKADKLDRNNWDNGVYLIDKDLNIVGREFFEGTEQRWHPYDEMLRGMNRDLPERMCLPEKEIKTMIESHGSVEA